MTLTVVNGRLPHIAIPSHYAVTYHRIDLDGDFTFEGQVVVQLKTVDTPYAPSSLVLHARDLSLVSAVIKNKDDKKEKEEATAVEFRYQLHHQTCEIIFDKTTFQWKPNTDYELTISFSGFLNDQMAGLYKSSYTDLTGQKFYMATTQFEPTDARRAFPCLDEPALKATFQLTVQNLPAHLQAVSNTRIIASHTQYLDTKMVKTVTFDPTPKMSTYLVALVIGQFDAISQTSPTSQIQTTIYTVPGKAHQGQFCLTTASRCLDFLQETYGVPYPLTKSDLLAIPDFSAGAMENWGCVTYREAKILVNENSTSETMKRGIARTVCHELAHMWFGNLVTPEFWTQLWLKEGVARFMEFVALDHLFPEWHAWDEFVQGVYNLALGLDSLQSSHPVEVPVYHSDEINEVFDAISYAKGASIIRMLCHYLGGLPTFMKGMQLYLTRHQYGNAVSEDFWTALSEVSGKPLVDFMKTWTTVTGFPLLQLKSDSTMTTTRFYASGPSSADDSTKDNNTKWPMPVTARVEGSDEILGPWVVHGPEKDESNELLQQIQTWTADGKWFKLNVDQHGFFRVNYTPEQWKRLALIMDPVNGPLSVTDRLGLISDSFASGKAGYASIVDSLTLIKGFGEHSTAEYVVWQELSSNLSLLASLYRSEAFFGQFQVFLSNLYTKQAALLGWEASPTESARTGTLRGTVLSMMGKAKDPIVLKEAHRRFMEMTKEPSIEGLVSGDIQGVLFRLALMEDEDSVFDALKTTYEEQYDKISPETQRDLLVVMGCVQDRKRHSDMLDYIFFSGKVRQQDMAFPLGSLSSASDQGGRATWDYFKRNYETLHAKLGTGFLWRDCVGLSCRGLKTAAEAQEVEDFFHQPNRSAGSGARRLQQALEVVRTSAARIERDRDALSAFFQN